MAVVGDDLYEGEPKDGNRRIAASLLVVYGKGYDAAQKERALHPRGTVSPQPGLGHARPTARQYGEGRLAVHG